LASQGRTIAKVIRRASGASRQAGRGNKEPRTIYSRKEYGKCTTIRGKLLLANSHGRGNEMNKIITPKQQGFIEGVNYALKELAKIYEGIDKTDIYHHFNEEGATK